MHNATFIMEKRNTVTMSFTIPLIGCLIMHQPDIMKKRLTPLLTKYCSILDSERGIVSHRVCPIK
jgi:hypothetical protein